jgi:hypothetical protein
MANRIIQLLHPGPEHGWDRTATKSTGWKDWNCGCHKRKFMVSDGLLTSDPNQKPVSGRFTFWGEWEPQSEVQLLHQKSRSGYPRWLHTPRLNLNQIEALRKQGCNPCAPGGPQNTDPLVFGDQFRYTLCQQFQKNTVNPTQLMQLNKGDIILFGSCVGGQFALDTVFVVGISAPLQRGGMLPNWDSELHQKITMNLFDIPQCGVRLYGSATWSSDKTFSFVPCLPIDGVARAFARPIIAPSGILSDVIEPSQKQHHKITAVESQEHAKAAWDAVVRQVLLRGCFLGTAVDEPPDARRLSGSLLHSETIVAAAEGHSLGASAGVPSSN